jgi:long-chain acyl-CoA synthetase
MNTRTEVSGEPAPSIPDLWFLDRFDEWTRREPDRFAFAVDHPDRTEEYTYADVSARSDAVARALAASGIEPGDRVGILMDNSPHWVFVLLGVIRIGAVGVPLSTLLPPPSIRRLGDHAGCRIVFADAANLETASEAFSTAAGVELVARAPELAKGTRWEDFLARAMTGDLPAAASPDGTAVLMYTSGTTGDPKGVRILSKGLSVDIYGLIHMLELDPGHRILSVLPFSHVLPLVANGLGALAAGCSVVFLPAITPQRIVEAFKKHRITFFVCVPQFFYAVHKRIFGQVAEAGWPKQRIFGAMAALSRASGSKALARRLFARVHRSIGSDLSLLITGGSRFEPKVAHDFQTLGYTMIQAYGLTETSAAATITPVADNALGTVGKPLPGARVRIDRPNDEGIGEVCLSGEILMGGYYRNEAATKEAIRDGWLHTGDLGTIDAGGNLTLTGRSKDVIVLSNGKNIYPEEIEEHYGKSPYVKEICVMGVAGSDGPGDRLHAVVVPDLDEFRKRNQTSIAEMLRYELDNLSRELASFMRVTSWSIRNDPLPRTVTRKLKRFEISSSGEAGGGRSAPAASGGEDHESLRAGIGLSIARAIRAAKPDVGPLGPSMNFDLDLGFDSLARVELLGAIESDLESELGDDVSNQIFTIGELIEAFERADTGAGAKRSSWKEKLSEGADAGADDVARMFIRESRTSLTFFGFPTIRLLGLLTWPFFRTRVEGLEKLPASGPFLICPNHVSYLDPFLLCSVLPFRVIRDIFILGYTDYFQGGIVGRLASSVNIVPVDPNANLSRAMQVAAVGLRKGRILLVFPEGERSIDGRLTTFKKGSAILSVELDAPLVPVGIIGTFEAWPRGGRVRPHPVRYRIGDPIDPKRFAGEADPYRAINVALLEAVSGLISEGNPPNAKKT